MTLEQIRTAVAAANPFVEMDHLVRQQLATGRRVADIVSDLNPLVDEVLETQGLTAAGEEAFLGTLDALLGNCRPDHCYYDLPHPTLAGASVPNAPATPSPTIHPV